MPHDPVLHMLGLARKAGKLELGEEPVGAVCRAHHARLAAKLTGYKIDIKPASAPLEPIEEMELPVEAETEAFEEE